MADGVATIISWSADSERVVYATRGLTEWNTIDVKTRDVVRLWDNPPDNRIGSPSLAPDDRWVIFGDASGREERLDRLWPSHLFGMEPWRGRTEWIPLAGQGSRGWWSPDGNLVYFYSTRDGFGCYWAWRLDPSAKQPMGEIIEVLHMHDGRHFLRQQAYGLASDRLYLAVRETTATSGSPSPSSPRRGVRPWRAEPCSALVPPSPKPPTSVTELPNLYPTDPKRLIPPGLLPPRHPTVP